MAKEKIELLSVDGGSDDTSESKTVTKRSPKKKDFEDEPLMLGDDNKKKFVFNKKTIIIIVLVILVILVAGIINNHKHKGEKKVADNKTGEKILKEDIHYVICSNPKIKYHGYDSYYELKYINNQFDSYTFSFILDKGVELADKDAWWYVEYYQTRMQFVPDKSGYTRENLNGPYQYKVYYTLTADHYCERLDGCDDTQLKWDHVDEMIPDFEEQLNLKCTKR